MKLDRRETILLGVLCFALGVAIALLDANPLSPMYLSKVINWDTAITCVGFVFLWYQLKETRKATRQTRRSVDAQIAAQRGRMTFIRIVAKDFEMSHPVISFMNVGQTAAILEDSAFEFTLHPTRPPTSPPEHSNMMNRANPLAIPQNETVSNGLEGPLCHMTPRKDIPWADVKELRVYAFVRGWVRFSTVFGKRYQQNFGALWTPAHGGYTVAEYPVYNREEELS